MKSDKRLQLLRVTLLLFAGITIFYGILHLFFPVAYVSISNGGPVSPAWIRFFGPILIALGIGAIMVYRNPAKQGIFVSISAVGAFGSGLAQLYSLFYDIEGLGIMWDTISPMIVNFVLSILLIVSLRHARDILW